jgi:hypothetical protein
VARFCADGRLDDGAACGPGFGTTGKVTTPIGVISDDTFDLPQSVAVQPDGRIVAVVQTGRDELVVVRYLGAPTDTPASLEVALDIRPGDAANRVNLRSSGLIPVAILSDANFDATHVDPGAVCFGDAEEPSERDCSAAHGRGHIEDANFDRRNDLVLHFETAQTGIDATDIVACLSGRTADRTPIQGCAPILTEPGGGRALTFVAVADTHVHSNAPRRNFGTSRTLEADASPIQQAFLRFELEGLGGARVTSATLRVFVTESSREGGGAIATTSVTDWDEAGVTFATRPIIDGSVLDELGPVRDGYWHELDVTAAVIGDGSVSFALTLDKADGAAYSSREGAHPPELVVTLAP